MKKLLEQAFNAGRNLGYSMGTGRPTYGLSFYKWYSENENKALNLANVSQQSELLQTFKNYLHEKYEPLQFDDYDIDCFIESLQ